MPKEEKEVRARAAFLVLALFAGTVLLGVAVIVLLRLPGLLAAVLLTALVLGLLGILLVITLLWQTLVLARLARAWKGVPPPPEAQQEE